MNTFEKGKQATEKLKRLLVTKGYFCEDVGREFTIKNLNIAKKINSDNTLTSLFIRFQPDLIVYKNEPFFIEVKFGRTIQKDAFFHYLRLENIGLNILIFILYKEEWYFSKPSEIEFFSYPSENGSMYHPYTNLYIPVQGHWVHPERLHEQELQKFKQIQNASGKTYGIIDLKRLKKL